MQTLEQRLSTLLTFFLTGREEFLAKIADLTTQVSELTVRLNASLEEITAAEQAVAVANAELEAARSEVARLQGLADADVAQDTILDQLLDSAEALLPPGPGPQA